MSKQTAYLIVAIFCFSIPYSVGSEALPTASPVEEKAGVFGFHWRITVGDANKLVRGKLVRDEAEHGKVAYKILNPQKPRGAKHLRLVFFNNELYEVECFFFFKDSNAMAQKYGGVVRTLKRKYKEAKNINLDAPELGSVFMHRVSFLNDKGDIEIENPYNLEEIYVTGTYLFSKNAGGVSVSYKFYGASKVTTHLEELANKAEFGDF